MEKEQVKEKIEVTVDRYAQEIIAFGERVMRMPEAGYKEEQTSALLRAEFDSLGVSYQQGLALTGVKATVVGRSDFLNICVIGELDAVKCPTHPTADQRTGMAHACGHNVQLANLVGVAYALVKSGIMQEMDGRVTLLAAPAEEFIDLEYRQSLADACKIQHFGGKQQLLQEGVFCDVDLAMMVHAQPNTPEAKVFVGGGSLGFDVKSIAFTGRAAHGAEPFEGVNALNAAALAILGIHANRETFREEDRVRIHPIITKGGDNVNSVPDDVRMETYVRGASEDVVKRVGGRVDEIVHSAAAMIGAKTEIITLRGYQPLKQDAGLTEVFADNARCLIPTEAVIYGTNMVGSTDMGDLSQVIPCIQPTMGGYRGSLHSEEFAVADADVAYLMPVKIMVRTIVDLLFDNAKMGIAIKNQFKGGSC